VHDRDRHRCMNCRATEEIAELLDVDHVVLRGVGGGEPLSNQITLCRRCHDAKHVNGLAPTVRVVSTGTMTDTEFAWYKHFVQEMVPALARLAGARLRPKFGLEGMNECACRWATSGASMMLSSVRTIGMSESRLTSSCSTPTRDCSYP
jgi:hypothetical protein